MRPRFGLNVARRHVDPARALGLQLGVHRTSPKEFEQTQETLTVGVVNLSLPDRHGILATVEIVPRRPKLRVLGLTR